MVTPLFTLSFKTQPISFLKAKLSKDPAERGLLPGGTGFTRATVAPGMVARPSAFPGFRVSPTRPDFCYARGKPQKTCL